MKDLAEAIGTEPLCRVLMIHDPMGEERDPATSTQECQARCLAHSSWMCEIMCDHMSPLAYTASHTLPYIRPIGNGISSYLPWTVLTHRLF